MQMQDFDILINGCLTSVNSLRHDGDSATLIKKGPDRYVFGVGINRRRNLLAEQVAKANTPEEAFVAYRERRFERCKYIVESSLAFCHGQIGKGPPVDNHKATAEMFEVTAQPI